MLETAKHFQFSPRVGFIVPCASLHWMILSKFVWPRDGRYKKLEDVLGSCDEQLFFGGSLRKKTLIKLFFMIFICSLNYNNAHRLASQRTHLKSKMNNGTRLLCWSDVLADTGVHINFFIGKVEIIHFLQLSCINVLKLFR